MTKAWDNTGKIYFLAMNVTASITASKVEYELTSAHTINKPKTLKILLSIRNLGTTIATASRIFEKAKPCASNTCSTPNPLRSAPEVTRVTIHIATPETKRQNDLTQHPTRQWKFFDYCFWIYWNRYNIFNDEPSANKQNSKQQTRNIYVNPTGGRRSIEHIKLSPSRILIKDNNVFRISFERNASRIFNKDYIINKIVHFTPNEEELIEYYKNPNSSIIRRRSHAKRSQSNKRSDKQTNIFTERRGR